MTHLAQCTSLLSLWRPIDEPRSTTLAQQRETPPVAAFTVFLEVLFHQFPPYINIPLYLTLLCELAHNHKYLLSMPPTKGYSPYYNAYYNPSANTWLAAFVKQSYAAFLSLPKHAASTPNSEHTIHTLGNSKPMEDQAKTKKRQERHHARTPPVHTTLRTSPIEDTSKTLEGSPTNESGS